MCVHNVLARLIVAGLLISLSGIPVMAAVDAEKLTISGQIRDRYEVRNNASFGNPNGTGVNQNNESFLVQRFRLNVNYDVTSAVRVFAQIQDARLFGAERGTLGNSQNLDLHQGYVQVDDVLLNGLNLRLGRQEIFFGDHRVLGNVGWTNVGRSFDAARLTLHRDVADFDLIWARTRETDTADIAIADVINFPGTPEALRKGGDGQDLYIAYGTVRALPNLVIEPYWIFLVDNGSGASLLAPATTNQARHTTGFRLDGNAFRKHIDYTGEFSYQFGSIASEREGNSVRDLDISALAFAVKGGYTFLEQPWTPRLGLEYDYASGDGGNNTDDQGGNFNTFENLFPTNHGIYGIMDLFGWRNMTDMIFSASVKPLPRTGITTAYHVFRLADRDDNWYRFNGGVMVKSQLGNQAASVGQELDITAYTTVKEVVKLSVGFAHFFSGEYIEKNNVADGQSFSGDQNWMYFMATVGF